MIATQSLERVNRCLKIFDQEEINSEMKYCQLQVPDTCCTHISVKRVVNVDFRSAEDRVQCVERGLCCFVGDRALEFVVDQDTSIEFESALEDGVCHGRRILEERRLLAVVVKGDQHVWSIKTLQDALDLEDSK